MKSPENLVQFVAWDPVAAVTRLKVHLRTAAATGDEHATAARGVINRGAHQVSHHACQQNRVTKDGGAGRDHAKLDLLQSRRLGELRGELLENETERYGLRTVAGGQ